MAKLIEQLPHAAEATVATPESYEFSHYMPNQQQIQESQRFYLSSMENAKHTLHSSGCARTDGWRRYAGYVFQYVIILFLVKQILIVT